jgi:hydrogenase/urease accessory protein HupE
MGILAAPLAAAHDLGVARVELREEPAGRYELDVTVPSRPDFLELRPALPARCRLETTPAILKRPGVAIMQFHFLCANPPLGPGDTLHLPWKREGVFVTARWLDGTWKAEFFGSASQGSEDGGVDVPVAELRGPSGRVADVAKRYFLLGIEHILTGWDHLAFVLCLCLVARGWRLVKLVTGFTLGHSLSLALAALDVIRLPSPPVEACIAMSIALMAREALLPPESRRHGAGLVFVFGLLHGLGFAGALREVGIGKAELLLGLLCFNLGVEAGQLLFVAAVLTMILLSSLVVPGSPRWRMACAGALGVLAAFWTWQRISVF